MAAFKGQAAYSVDSKGRVAIPAKMRNVMNPAAENTFVMTRGFEKCVFLYPKDTWAAKEAEIAELNLYRGDARDFVRIIMMWADEVPTDKQGRVSISKPLLEFAGITDKALIIGAFDHVEIWNPDVFEAHLNQQTETYETLAERVLGV